MIFAVLDWLQNKVGHLEWSGETSLHHWRPIQVYLSHISDHEYFSGNMSLSSTNWSRQSLMKSVELLDAGNRADTGDTVSSENRLLQPLNQSITFLPCGPSPTRPRLRLRSWSTQAPLWWLTWEEPTASFLASPSSRFGTNLEPCGDFFEHKIGLKSH